MTSVLAFAGLVGGCTNSPSLIPNPDTTLRLSSTQFAADAAKRHPYKVDEPRGEPIPVRASIDYGIDRIEIANLSDTNWQNVEVWVNKNYVVFVPNMETGTTKVLPFGMLFDEAGNHFPTNNTKVKVNTIEIVRDGTIYDVHTQLAD